jgi:hypothetical protein
VGVAVLISALATADGVHRLALPMVAAKKSSLSAIDLRPIIDQEYFQSGLAPPKIENGDQRRWCALATFRVVLIVGD